MQDEDLEDGDIQTETKLISKEEGISHKLDDVPEGKADCYWCGRIFDIMQMRRQIEHHTIVYICKDCG
jgi:DNA-directed RNA polymerase subunit M/transcription elongation factor TFIIS